MVEEGGAIARHIVFGVVERPVVVQTEEAAVVIRHGAARGHPQATIGINHCFLERGSIVQFFDVKAFPCTIGAKRPDGGVGTVVQHKEVAGLVIDDSIRANV